LAAALIKAFGISSARQPGRWHRGELGVVVRNGEKLITRIVATFDRSMPWRATPHSRDSASDMHRVVALLSEAMPMRLTGRTDRGLISGT
jgi:hypothetical protein